MTMEIRNMDGESMPNAFEFHEVNNVLLHKVGNNHWELHVDESTITIQTVDRTTVVLLKSCGSMTDDYVN